MNQGSSLRPHIVALGSAVIDMSFGGTIFPIVAGKHQLFNDRLITPGGMANTALCAARLGLRVTKLGVIGSDDLADSWRAPLSAENVDVADMLAIPDQPTSVTMVLSEQSGDHVFVSHRGDLRLSPGYFPERWQTTIAGADALCIDGWNYLSMGPDVNLMAIEIATRAGIPIFYDPGPWIDQTSAVWRDAMLARCSVVLLTLDEAEMALGRSLSPPEAAQAIIEMGPEMVVLKQGSDGMLVQTATDRAAQKGLVVPVRDLTGAGDSVMAAIMLAYLARYPLPKMLAIANATGAVCVQKFGAGINVPFKAEVLAELRKAGSQYEF